MKLAFSTLGCPTWGLERIADAAVELGYRGIELRALGGDIDLLRRPELKPSNLVETRRFFERHRLVVCCVDTACSFQGTEADGRANIDVALRHAEIAAELGAGLIRVFPNEVPAGVTRQAARERIVRGLKALASRMPANVLVGLETHGDFASGRAVAELVEAVGDETVAIVWDVANTTASGESVHEAADAVAPYLAHVHLRDAQPVAGTRFWRPVLAGRGSVRCDEALAVLRRLRYDGFVSFEWEKYWYPEIEEPEIALADFASRCAG